MPASSRDQLIWCRYTGRDICWGYNEDTLTIYDADQEQFLSRETYDGVRYSHQVSTRIRYSHQVSTRVRYSHQVSTRVRYSHQVSIRVRYSQQVRTAS